MNWATAIFPTAAIAAVLMIFLKSLPALRAQGGNSPAIQARPGGRWRRKDSVLVLALTVLYAVVAFLGLGDLTAPQRFCKFKASGSYAQIELAQETDITNIQYYTGLHSAKYYIKFSSDGVSWTDAGTMSQEYNDLFKWKLAELHPDAPKTRYIQIVANGKAELGEIALFDNGGRISAETLVYDPGTGRLLDEQSLVPPTASYMNSTYFDEIYHARTAYENIENVYPYEVSHPPLGKLIIAGGIRLLGMTPFGWRFSGTLFGVLMVPILYVFLRLLFGSTALAFCGSAVFAFDFMHFVQTRIATIDTYAVFFTLLMYLFMYRFISADPDDPLKPAGGRQAADLFLSGLFFGLGAASKWTCVYAGGGLAVLWLLYWLRRGRGLILAGHGKRLVRELAVNIPLCIAFFIVVPAVVYYVSYWPYGTASGLSGPAMLFKKEYFDLVLDNQKFMFDYHVDVKFEHPYSSRWFQWIADVRPILYYLEYPAAGYRQTIGAFVSPLLCWLGLLSVLTAGYYGVFKKDGRALFIFIGWLAQLLPWLFITRLTFEYHYFPSVVFLVLAVCWLYDARRRQFERFWRGSLLAFTGLSLGLFVAFYPVLSGALVSDFYTNNFLGWLPSWPF